MNNKNILIITPFFAPETHAAVFRAYKLVKYLKRFGWNPIVLTVDTNYVYKEDPTLLDDINDVSIYRARYIEPTLRGLKMALGGKDRTYKNLSPSACVGAQGLQASSKPSWKARAYSYLLNRWIQVPDRFVTWQRSAVKMGKRLIKQHDISVIYTTCLPFSTNVIGMRLKQATGVKWVADFRDPITYAKRMYSDYLPVFMKQKRIEQLTFEHADAIVGLSESYLYIFNDLYQGKYDHKCHFIPTGADDDYLPEETIEKGDYLIFVGEYLKEYGNHFLGLLKQAIAQGHHNLTLKIVGSTAINRPIVEPIVKELGIEKNVEFADHMPQRNLYRLIKGAKAAVLIPGKKAHWWNNFAKMVDYIALQVPVIADVPHVSEARAQLTKAGLGIFITGTTSLQNSLNDLNAPSLRPNREFCNRYLASSQVKSFIDIFNSL
ncbi:MAG: hypothetical protein J6N71_05150 [Muribaculaceae bacterium]|nr:hypothetical protein [Muribaculaceae bacterium]